MIAAVPDSPDDDHPALLLARAQELFSEAEALAAQVKERRMEAARLRARAERLSAGLELAPKPKPDKLDPLLAAAGVAAEGLTGVWELRELAAALGVRDMARAVRLASALEGMGLIARSGEGWRNVDTDEARVRDTLRELGVCKPDQLAAKLELSEAALDELLEDGARRGWVHVMDDGTLMYQRPGPERAITRHPHRRPPEKDPPSYTEAPYRGEPVRVVHHGKRGAAMSNPGVRHREKLKDKARERQETARRERAEAQAAKAAAARNKGRR